MSTAGVLRRRSTIGMAALCAAGLLLTGCGADTATPAGSPAAAAATTSAAQGEVSIADSWVKATAGTEDSSMTAAFGVLTNHTDKELTIVSATNDVTDRTELHEMAMVDGAMVMRPIEGGIKIPANGSTTLEPGGLHVMIMDAKKAISPGDEVNVTLTFNDGTTMPFTALAKEFAGANEQYDGGSSMDMGTSKMDMGTSSMDMGTGSDAAAPTSG